MGDGFGMGLGGGLMWLFWILLIIGVVWAAKVVMGRGNTPTNNGKSALEILKERYAKGEIDRKEFEQKRRDLGG
jgi:putative membrane protein